MQPEFIRGQKQPFGSLDPRPGDQSPLVPPTRLARFVDFNENRWIEIDLRSGVRVAEGQLGEHPDLVSCETQGEE